jgi:hypothetical protein
MTRVSICADGFARIRDSIIRPSWKKQQKARTIVRQWLAEAVGCNRM